MRCTTTHGLLRRIALTTSAALVAAAGLAASPGAHAQSGQNNIEGNFTRAEDAVDWTFFGNRYGKPMAPKMDGSGWLRMTENVDGVVSQAQANAKLPSTGPIRVEFEAVYWGGPYGNVALYFADASAPSAGTGGRTGAASGYCGMAGAYLGLALDEGGYFSRWNCGLGPGIAASGNPGHGNALAIRGPQSRDYPYVTSVSLNDHARMCDKCTSRAQAAKSIRHVVLNMTPRSPAGSGYVLSAAVNGQDVIRDMDFPYAPPAELLVGIASTTGSGGAVNEIRNLKVSSQGNITATNCLNGVGPDGRCLRARNDIKDWQVYAQIGNMGGINAPAELVDGDLVQKGWDFSAAWTKAYPKISEPDNCLSIGPQSPFGDPILANQIIIVSRQDNSANPVDPTPETTFTKYGAVDFEVMYNTPDNMFSSPTMAAHITGNNKVMRVIDLPKTEKIMRVSLVICKTADGNSSPLTEFLLREKK